MVIAKNSRIALSALLLLMCAVLGCAARASRPPFAMETLGGKTVWLPTVRNSTGGDLRLPGTNPLRSLAEMAGKVSPDYRRTVMDILRDSLKNELTQKGFQIALPEEKDARFTAFSTDIGTAVRIAREGNLSGAVFASEIRRWEVESQKFVRVLLDFKLIRIDDGAVLWQRRFQGAISTPSATNVGQASTDAAAKIVRELFAG